MLEMYGIDVSNIAISSKLTEESLVRLDAIQFFTTIAKAALEKPALSRGEREVIVRYLAEMKEKVLVLKCGFLRQTVMILGLILSCPGLLD